MRNSLTAGNAGVFARPTAARCLLRRHIMTTAEMKDRTMKFAVSIIKFAKGLPDSLARTHIARQVVRSGTAIGANYRASCRAKSRADFVSKMTTVEEEADETMYWLELLIEAEEVPVSKVSALMNEADQLVRIVVASIRTAREGRR